MPKSNFNGFSHNEAALNPYDNNPEISKDIQQSVAMLEGWNEALSIFKLLRSDSVGRLLVSLAPPATPNVNQTTAAVGAVETNPLVANQNRRLFIIQNVGANSAYISYTAGLALAQMLIIPTGGLWTEDLWNGPVFVRSQPALVTTLTIWEY